MFEQATRAASSPEVIARFDELFERRYPSRTTESAALLDRIGASWRAQNRAAAAALVAIGELFAYRLTRCSDTEDWAVDTEAAVSAEVAAALRMSQGLAASQLRYARAMRERLPKLAEVFQAGDIDQQTFATIVYRTDLITDRDVLATVDGQLALTVVRWPSMTRSRLAGHIDKIVAKADVDAVRRRTERRTEREVWFADLGSGLSEIHGSLLSPDAHAWTSGSLRWPARCASTIHALASNAALTRWRWSRRAPIDWAVAAGVATAPRETCPPQRLW
jgi:hypothetical protein